MASRYNPEINNRRSIRLQGYDYSRQGAYFVTMCAQNRECLFGKINNGEMELNDAGKMINKWWMELVNKFKNIELDKSAIMPNHFHGIISIGGDDVGADLCVCPVRVYPGARVRAETTDTNTGIATQGKNTGLGKHAGLPLHGPDACNKPETTDANTNVTRQGRHAGLPLHRVVQWFKTMTTNEYLRNIYEKGWQRLDGKLWQRNYYERIIRNETEMNRIRQYIINNPLQWDNDENNPGNVV